MLESATTSCPYCGEPVELSIDVGGGDRQSYVEDCPVCCQPCQVEAVRNDANEWDVTVRTADE